jgi:hypothetical protein
METNTLVGAALENFPPQNQKNSSKLHVRKQKKEKERTRSERTPLPKSPIFHLIASSGNQREGQYYAMISLRTPSFGDVVARWRSLRVPLRRQNLC